MYEDNFMKYYRLVRPTVFRLKSLYHVRLWTTADWEQEAMTILFILLEEHPQLKENISVLRVYFKTKFSNRVKDMLRRQDALKRQFNRLSKEDISDMAQHLASKELVVDERVAFYDCLKKVKQDLSALQLNQLEKVMMGETFKGKAAFIRELRGYFE